MDAVESTSVAIGSAIILTMSAMVALIGRRNRRRAKKGRIKQVP